jgi:hypothetical protein
MAAAAGTGAALAKMMVDTVIARAVSDKRILLSDSWFELCGDVGGSRLKSRVLACWCGICSYVCLSFGR